MPERIPSESWTEYRRLVLATLERFESDIEDLKKISGKIENLEKAITNLKQTVYGPVEDESHSLRNRVLELENYIKDAPTLKKPALSGPEGEPSTERTNTKMLVLLVGAVSGLVALATTIFEFAMNLMHKT